MNEHALDTMLVVRSLARELALQIGATYMPEDMAECGGALVPLYLARRLGATSETQEMVITKIEQAIASDHHYSCSDCGALFGDTDDLELLTQADIDLLKPGQIRPIGKCPVCRQGAVYPQDKSE
jgi:hypothetical protein